MNTVTMLPMYVAGFENAASLFRGADVIRPPLTESPGKPGVRSWGKPESPGSRKPGVRS